MSRRSWLSLVGGVGAIALGAGLGAASEHETAELDVNANALTGHWTSQRAIAETTAAGAMERSKPHVGIIVNGFPGDQFDAAIVTFGSLGRIDSREKGGMIVRKKPGRTTYGHQLLLPAVQIPQPERDLSRVTVQVDLYAGQGSGDRLVASGTDVVSVANADCTFNCLAK